MIWRLVGTSTGLAREPPAAPVGAGSPGVCRVGRCPGPRPDSTEVCPAEELEVGLSIAVLLPDVADRRTSVVIIGLDPHKRTHTASALEPGTHRVLATLQIEATLAGYRQLLRWAGRFESPRCPATRPRSLWRTPRRRWRCSTSGGRTWSRTALGWSTSCTRCCATSFP